jgi:hypothetical protein
MTRKKNPLKAGYSRATVSHNIALEMDNGRKQRQAVAMALRSARASFKKRYPGKRLPAHLHYKTNPWRDDSAGHSRAAKLGWKGRRARQRVKAQIKKKKKTPAQRRARNPLHHNYYVVKGKKFFNGSQWVSSKRLAAVWHSKDMAAKIARKIANLTGEQTGVLTETKKH